MFQQVYVQVGLELASRGEVIIMLENAQHRVQRAGALAVVSLSMPLPEAGSATPLGAFLKATRAQADRPSTSLVVGTGFGRIEDHGCFRESAPDRIAVRDQAL